MDLETRSQDDPSAESEVLEAQRNTADTSASNTPDAVITSCPVKAEPDGSVPGTDEASRLRELQADIRDQDDLERDISRQVHTLHKLHSKSLFL